MKCKITGEKLSPFMSFGKMPSANGFLDKKDFNNEFFYEMEVGFSKKVSENILEDFLSIILDELIQNKKVKIPKFGSFILRNKKSRVGRNPKTLEKKIITERNVVLFRPSKELKKKLNNNG